MSKRLLCLLLCATMLLSCGIPVLGATFSDVPETNQYYEAIDLLSEFGIILGDAGTGTFRPDAEISREEFSVIVTRILGVSNIVPSMENLPFEDVNPIVCDEWAIVATKLAYDLGIVSGYGNGKFGPKDPVTYEQVVKMLVCTIGYGPAAIENGGWPNGYIKVANDLGITENAVMLQTGNAPRGIVAQLVYNCLDIDLMENVGNGQSEIKYGRTLLTDKLGYRLEEGVVSGIPGTAFDMTGKVINEGEVEFDGKSIYNAGNTNAAEYFGLRGEFYYKQKGNIKTLVSFVPSEDNVILELDPEKFVSVTEDEIEYYVNDDETKTDVLNIKGAVYMYNGKAKDLDEIERPNIGTMKLIDNNDDEVIDVIILDDTRVAVVGAWDAVKKIITNKFNTSERIYLDGQSKEVVVLKDGIAATTSAIARDSVVMISENDEKITVNVITKTVTGTIESEEENGEILGVNKKTYEVMPAYLKYMKENPAEQLEVGDSVTVYVTPDNQILYGKIKTVSTKLGYLIYAAPDEDDEVTQARVLDSSGKIQVREFAEKVKINGVRYEYDEIVDELINTAKYTNKDAGASGATVSQLIEYTESGGKIDSVITMQTSGDRTRGLILDVPYTAEKYQYSSTNKKLGTSNIILDSKTKVFKIPTSRSSYEDYAVKTGTSGLTSSYNYQFEAFDVSDTGVAGAIVVYGNTQSLNQTWTGIAVIGSLSSKMNDEDESVYSVELITNGKSSTKETESLAVLKGYKTGDVIHYATKNGVISEVKKVYSPASGEHKFIEGVSNYKRRDHYYDFGSKSTLHEALANNIVAGVVYSRDDSRMVIAEGEVDENGNISPDAKRHVMNITDSIVYYLYDASKSKPFITKDITKEYMSTYLDVKESATKVVVLSGSYTSVKFVYIIDN